MEGVRRRWEVGEDTWSYRLHAYLRLAIASITALAGAGLMIEVESAMPFGMIPTGSHMPSAQMIEKHARVAQPEASSWLTEARGWGGGERVGRS